MLDWKWSDADEFRNKYAADMNQLPTFIRVSRFFDSMGTLVRNGLTETKFMHE
ncbi:MAG: hypothetical protein ACE5H4_06880 [Candidatus Thorarchaeota archaeon]